MNETRGSNPSHLLLAAGAGVLVMYLLDPQQGRRRTALARDRLTRLARITSDFADASLRDLGQRSTGLSAELRGLLRPDTTSDEVLVDRVRSRIGRLTSHPHAVKVAAAAGGVTLSGPVLADEEGQLLQGVRSVRGVRRVENRLDVHRSADGIPALQGGTARPEPRPEFMQENWAPGPRLLMLAGGAALALCGLGRRSPGGVLLGALGTGLAACAGIGGNGRGTPGLADGRRAVDIEKTIRIAASRERVFDCWADVDNFPHIMSRVEAVRRLDEDRSHWVVKGPAGSRLEWDSRITESVRPEVLAWRSEPGAAVQHAGIVRFDEVDGGTEVVVHMSYCPPGGAFGHRIASLLGRDPKQDLDADLMRMKSFLETGVAAHDAAASRAPSSPGRTGADGGPGVAAATRLQSEVLADAGSGPR